MAKVKVELNLKGINELMMSPGIQGALHEAGQAVARAAGEGFESSTHEASFVAIENVYPTTAEAYYDEIENNTLLKAAGAVGLYMDKPRMDLSGGGD